MGELLRRFGIQHVWSGKPYHEEAVVQALREQLAKDQKKESGELPMSSCASRARASPSNPIPVMLEETNERPFMSKQLDVIYENGVFRPLEPVDVREHQRMTITIPEASMVPSEEAWFDAEYERWVATQVQEDVSLEAVRQVLSKIPGSLTADFLAERAEP
jgi:predicted DNA-binding antitoxin AbrB/MazE fold protein